MTDLEFQIVMKLRRLPQRQSHFHHLGPAHELALEALVRREMVERAVDGQGVRIVKLTHKGRQQGHTEWVHRGRPELKELLNDG